MEDQILDAAKVHIENSLCDMCVYRTEGVKGKCRIYPNGLPLQFMLKREFVCDKFAMFDFFEKN